MPRVSFIFGTRPEAIKLCPVIDQMRSGGVVTTHVCVTAQHRELLDQVLGVFDIVADVDLGLMRPGQSLAELTARAVSGVDAYLDEHRPDLVLVQGDTTTVFCASLCAFYRRIPVGHVEAGLRTWNKYAPFPEEVNRVITTRLAEYHFAPTERARDNLLREGVPDERIRVTGNTVIDALHIAVRRVTENPPVIPGLDQRLIEPDCDRPMVLITGHRRENFGEGFRSICSAIATLADRYPAVAFVYPVHPNPNVRAPVHGILGNRKNIFLTDPLDYLQFVALMNKARVILTDSGGVQEEAPSLGKPVLVMRDTTERPEAIEAGTARLVGTDAERIIDSVSLLLTNDEVYAAMSQVRNPYGDGMAAKRIAETCEQILTGGGKA